MADEITVIVQVKFTEIVDGAVFRDALYFSENEWQAITTPELAAMKQARIDNWLAAVNASSQQDYSNNEEG